MEGTVMGTNDDKVVRSEGRNHALYTDTADRAENTRNWSFHEMKHGHDFTLEDGYILFNQRLRKTQNETYLDVLQYDSKPQISRFVDIVVRVFDDIVLHHSQDH